MGGAGAWATIVTGEAIGSLVGGLIALRVQANRSMLVIGFVFTVTAPCEGDRRRGGGRRLRLLA